MTAILKVKNLSKIYSLSWTRQSFTKSIRNHRFKVVKTVVFEGLNFEILPGEIVGLVGSNGSGKSTLLKILADVLNPTSGSVERLGTIVPLLSPLAFTHNLLDVEENILNLCEFYNHPHQPDTQAIRSIAHDLEIVDKLDQPFAVLSTGTVARLSLTMGLASPGSLFLIDELLTALDQTQVEKYSNIMRAKQQAGASFIITSHEPTIIQSLCSRIIQL